MNAIDTVLSAADAALRTLSGSAPAARRYPAPEPASSPSLGAREKSLSGALMRVNHVGEVCAQALYTAQALSTSDPALQRQFQHAAREETDHLAWTQRRLEELGARRSMLNPLWYAGSFAIGYLAGRAGDAVSLGFVVETERQVERHLGEHLERLPVEDLASRSIVRQMKEDEARHGAEAMAAGARELPLPARWLMRLTAKVMTTTARYV